MWQALCSDHFFKWSISFNLHNNLIPEREDLYYSFLSWENCTSETLINTSDFLAGNERIIILTWIFLDPKSINLSKAMKLNIKTMPLERAIFLKTVGIFFRGSPVCVEGLRIINLHEYLLKCLQTGTK